MTPEEEAAEREHVRQMFAERPDIAEKLGKMIAAGKLSDVTAAPPHAVMLILGTQTGRFNGDLPPFAVFRPCQRCKKEIVIAPSTRDMIAARDPKLSILVCHECMDKVFPCPRCGRVSYNENDARFGFCAACDDFTG